MFFLNKLNNIFKKELRAVLYTWTRTGASNLTEILSMHQDIRSFREPFNPGQEHFKFIKDKNPKEFRIILDNIWEKYNLIKHNHGLTRVQDKILLTESSNKVIFLWRKNASKREVSRQMSQQTKIWKTINNPTNKIKIRNFNYKALEIHILLKKIEQYLDAINTIRRMLHKHHVNHIEIVFEDIYEKNIESGIGTIRKVFDFLVPGYDLSDDILNKIYWRLDPANSKQTTPDIYNKIPNITEVNTVLSSKGYGSLF